MLPVEAGSTLLSLCTGRGGADEATASAAIARGGAFVAGRRETDAARPLRAGEAVEVALVTAAGRSPGAPASAARILHLDPWVVAIDKPAGIEAQQGRAGGDALGELTSALLRERGEAADAFLVHRLDRGTTGLTLFARTREAQAKLLASFRDGRVRKQYFALVAGRPAQEEGELDAPLGPDEAVPGRRRIDPQGEPARTRYQLVESFALDGGSPPRASALAAFPQTGRTHQIRVHFAALGCPLLGDPRYGGPQFVARATGERLELLRPLLHASRLELRHPRGRGKLTLESPLPADLAAALDWLRGAPLTSPAP